MIGKHIITHLMAGIVAAGLIGQSMAGDERAFEVQPNGIFFNRFSGGFDGAEWFQTFPIEGTDKYYMADIQGGGMWGIITADGRIVLQDGIGEGRFSDVDNYVIKPHILGDVFQFVCVRAPFTDAEFILQLGAPHPANPVLSGSWDATTAVIDPQTGDVIESKSEPLQLLAEGTTLRLTDSQGEFFQGVFANGSTVAFRRIVPEPKTPGFQSFAGSDISIEQDMLGQVRFTGNDRFSGVFLLQSRTPLGTQTQKVLRYRATRVAR